MDSVLKSSMEPDMIKKIKPTAYQIVKGKTTI